jgi:hypothetical protein
MATQRPAFFSGSEHFPQVLGSQSTEIEKLIRYLLEKKTDRKNREKVSLAVKSSYMQYSMYLALP